MKIGILGTGSWGLTLAWLWSQSADASGTLPSVWLWDRKPEKLQAIATNRTLTFPVSMTLPDTVTLTPTLDEALLAETDIIILAVTASGTRDVCQQLARGALPVQTILVNTSKGIELPSLKRLSEVIHEELPRNPQAVLSGPTLAKEMLYSLPTAACIASEDLAVAVYLQGVLSRDYRFRLYSNPDVTGVELGGALKNIFAISSGYIAQKQLGDNARAALLTRGLAEMTRFCLALGAQEMTIYGLSGLGDLFATSNSPLSRNYQVGQLMAQGLKLEAILEKIQVTAEGVQTTEAVAKLAEQLGIEMPIVQEINRALFEAPSDEAMIRSLMGRKLKAET